MSPLGVFYPTVLIAALIGGFGPGLASVAGGAVAWWALIPPRFSFAVYRTRRRGHACHLCRRIGDHHLDVRLLSPQDPAGSGTQSVNGLRDDR